MSQLILFVQVQERPGIVEVEVAEALTEAALHEALVGAGVSIAPESFVFVEECETPLNRESSDPVKDLRHGTRVHVSRCHRIATTVHFLDKTIEKHFPTGARVRAVKAWAAHEFHLDHKDAAEHVLQICNATTRPPSDTPLHTLVHDHLCVLCFDLVPEKRVEG